MYTEAADPSSADFTNQRSLSEFLARIWMGNVDFVDGSIHGCDGIADGHTGVGITAWVDQNGIGIKSVYLNCID